jgi:hypothetical protein
LPEYLVTRKGWRYRQEISFRNLTRLPLIQLHSPRFFCRPTAFFSTCWSRGTSESSSKSEKKAVGRQRKLGLPVTVMNFCICIIPVIPKVRRTVAKVRQKLSWTDKIILIVGPIDRLTYARKYFIFGRFSNNCQIKIFYHCSDRKFSLSSRKIPFLFLKYWYGDFSNCRKGILNPYLYYAFNNEPRMAKFQAIICHRSFVEIKMLGHSICSRGRLFLERVWKGKPRKVTTSGRKRRRMKKIERHLNLTWSGWPIVNGWITMRATTSWHVKYGKDDDDDDFCEDWHDEVENCLHIWIYKRIKYCT